MIVNFDKAATSRIDNEVLEFTMPYLTDLYYNPSSSYDGGKKCRKAIEEVRLKIAAYIGATPQNVIFTSSSSASNTLAIKGFLERNSHYDIIVSTIEHIDILDCVHSISHSSWFNGQTMKCTVDSNGHINMEQLEKQCAYSCCVNNRKPFVILQYVNNELGVIQDITKATQIVHQYNGIIMCDATQAITKIGIDVKLMDVDLLSFGGHKISAFRGIGVLYKKEGIELEPLVYGHQGLQSGTENTAAIISIGKALELNPHVTEIMNLKQYFEQQIIENIDCYINCDQSQRVCSISNVCFKNIESDTLFTLLNMNDIYVSKGSACNSEQLIPSHVLKAIGLKEPNIYCCLRFSFDSFNTKTEIDHVIKSLINIIHMLNTLS